jgi:hypothetical protein
MEIGENVQKLKARRKKIITACTITKFLLPYGIFIINFSMILISQTEASNDRLIGE